MMNQNTADKRVFILLGYLTSFHLELLIEILLDFSFVQISSALPYNYSPLIDPHPLSSAQ